MVSKISIDVEPIFKDWDISKDEELRIITINKINVSLIEGDADIFGVPLIENDNSTIELSNVNVGIYCWKNSKIRISGEPKTIYKKDNKSMQKYLLGYYLINETRIICNLNKQIGPRVLIIGSKCSGKRSLTRIFINYSLKNGFKPIYADLSINNDVGIPGSVGAVVVDNVMSDFTCNDFFYENSFQYFHGHLDVNRGKNLDLYLKQISNLGKTVVEKLTNDLNQFNEIYDYSLVPNEQELFSTGCIVRYDSNEIEIVKLIIESFNINMIFVMDDEFLYSQTKEECKSKNISVFEFPKNPGVVSLDNEYKQNMIDKKLSNYFNGFYSNFILKPMNIEISKIKILEILPSLLNEHNLPVGHQREMKVFINEVQPSNDLIGRVFSINHFSEKFIEQIKKHLQNNDNNDLTKHRDLPFDYTDYIDDIINSNVQYYGHFWKCESNIISINTYCDELELAHNVFIIGSLKYKS